jgi:hypothetical protein
MASYIGRRNFLATPLGGAAAGWPLAARAAGGVAGDRVPHFQGARRRPAPLAAIRRDLKDTRFCRGSNVVIECRFAAMV